MINSFIRICKQFSTKKGGCIWKLHIIGKGITSLKDSIYIQSADILLADTPQKPNHTEKEFLHMKSLFEQLGGTCHEENGYLIPNLRLLAEEEKSIGTWGGSWTI